MEEKNEVRREDMPDAPARFHCIKCGMADTPQDMRGWEQLLDHPEFDDEDIWLCPNCIYATEACHYYAKDIKRQLIDLENACATIYFASQKGMGAKENVEENVETK